MLICYFFCFILFVCISLFKHDFFCLAEKSLKPEKHNLSEYDSEWKLTDSLTQYIKFSQVSYFQCRNHILHSFLFYLYSVHVHFPFFPQQKQNCTLERNESIPVKDLLTIIKNCTSLLLQKCPTNPKRHPKKEFNHRFAYLPN